MAGMVRRPARAAHAFPLLPLRPFAVRLMIPAMLLVSIFALSGCGQSRTTAGSPVRLGLVVPRTSGVPGAAAAAVQGAELAVEEINADRGIQGRRLELVVVDDRGVPDEAARLVERLAADGVVGIVGPLTDATAIAGAAVAERRQVPIISPGAIGQLPYGGHFVFRTSMPGRAQARAMATYLVGTLGARRIAVVHDSNDYGTAVAMAFEEAARSAGAQITSRRLYRDGDKNFTRHIQGAEAEQAHAVFIAGYPDEGALILRQMRAAGLDLTVAGSDAMYSQDIVAWGGPAAEGLYAPAGFHPASALPVVRDFVSRYQAAYNQTPNQFAAQAYDAVHIFAVAVRRAGTDRMRIRDTVAGLRRFPGVTGQLSFDQWGDPQRSVTITRVESGAFTVAGP